MKKNVLIFGGGSYSASQVYFALKDSLRYRPILASSNDNHSTFICKNAKIDLPYDSSPNFVSELNRVIRENGIEFIIPTHDTAALRLRENEDLIEAIIVCSPLETTKMCRYKSMTYECLKEFDFVPTTYLPNEGNFVYPLFAKDDVGQGGKNSHLINSEEDLLKLNSKINYVYCEYLPGEEITIDCFTDRNGRLLFCQPRTRARILNGISARTENLVLTDEIKNIVESISSKIKFRGYWFIQCKKDRNGKYKLLEIATRFAGTFGLSKNLDVNLPLLALQDFSDVDVSVSPNNYHIIADKSYIDRYLLDYEYERVYIDFDDTIVFERERYNIDVIRFIYQCLNMKKQIYLITKHEFDIFETMKKVRLNKEIFDEIVIVPKDRFKWEYMEKGIPAIFIDNAYNERMLVKRELGIPTFDVTNVECLIDWRNI